MATKKTLLEKYDIPINHLEFDYIKNCTDAREIEKIVMILRSGEEGYFPDLMKCAEDKLRELKPNSRLFRFEESIHQQILGENELHPVLQWSETIRGQDNKLSSMCRQAAEMFKNLGIPEMRRGGRIVQKAEEQPVNTDQATTSRNVRSGKPIVATDYRKWDKYDPDEEILRMELDEERVREGVERKNRINSLKSRPTPLISELASGDENNTNIQISLTDVEKENLCLEYRIRGNEFYRAKEYESAIREYDLAIANHVDPQTAAYAYSNRAIANIKLKNYNEAIKDCEKCLQFQPDNIKALLRLAEAKLILNQKSEAYHAYGKILEFYPDNRIAAKAMQDILDDLHGHIAPRNATRIQIAEEMPTTSKAAKKKTQPNVANPNVQEKPSINTDIDELDYSKLIKPNKEKVNKFYAAAKVMNDIKSEKQQQALKNQVDKECMAAKQQCADTMTLRIPKNNSDKVLIEEVKDI